MLKNLLNFQRLNSYKSIVKKIMTEVHYYGSEDFHFHVDLTNSSNSEFEKLVQQKWEEAKEKGYFRYKLDSLETKILDGKYRFIAQLNVKRAQERRKPQTISNIEMPFDPNLFNFTKVKPEEIMFYISCKDQKFQNSSKKIGPLHSLIINVSPLEYCSSLLVPYVNSCLPQILTEDGLRLAVEILLLTNNVHLKIGCNSLGAYASVNHFHFHIYYLFHNLYLETAKVKHLFGDCYTIVDYPAEGFAFEIINENYDAIIKSVIQLVDFLLKNCIAHNIFITRGISFKDANDAETNVYKAVRIYVWARNSSFGAKNDEAFNPALCELAGHLPVKNESSFLEIRESQVSDILNETCHNVYIDVKNKIANMNGINHLR